MSELSEEEIIDNAEKLTYEVIVEDDLHNWDDMSPNEIATIMKGLLDLYQKEKQKNEKIQEKIQDRLEMLEREKTKTIRHDGFISVADEAQIQLCKELLEERN